MKTSKTKYALCASLENTSTHFKYKLRERRKLFIWGALRFIQRFNRENFKEHGMDSSEEELDIPLRDRKRTTRTPITKKAATLDDYSFEERNGTIRQFYKINTSSLFFLPKLREYIVQEWTLRTMIWIFL